MYRHILVPIDGSDLSIDTVGRAVELARSSGARITFLHTSPLPHAQGGYDGHAREPIAKAQSAARALGVPCETRTAPAGSPHQAIVAAARDGGCDLIFMGSNRRRTSVGLMIGSQTLKVLMNAGVPVLVSAIIPPGPAARALDVIRDEHRSLSVALHAWLHHLEGTRRQAIAPDARLMRLIVRYLRDFPVALHHRREADVLFTLLRSRTSQLDAEIEELERQHMRDHEFMVMLEAMVELVAEGKAEASELEEAVSRYATFVWEHLGREEGVILPATERHLTEQDWEEVAEAFAPARGQRSGEDTAAEFRRLLSNIIGPTSGR